ncbi:MAG TPA: NUDIX hydrolase [Chloroflexota bacterium]|nr:NUDIX hydrolase [Chloroflexota bacterium]
MSPADRIRPIAICVIRRDERLLVFEGHDPAKPETFYRPLGGGIDFGERGSDAVARELREEIDAEIHNIRYLGMLENIFVFGGRPKHELVQVYEADLVDEALYSAAPRVGHEDDGTPFQVMWKHLSEFVTGGLILYPDGLVSLLTA